MGTMFFRVFILEYSKFGLSLHDKTQGLVAEWLGTGLQNRIQQFESAPDLNSLKKETQRVFFLHYGYAV